MRTAFLGLVLLALTACGGEGGPPSSGAPGSKSTATLTGSVTDAETGAPIANATIRVVQGEAVAGRSDPDTEFELSAVTTGADGRYRIEDLEGNVTATVLVAPRGFAPQGQSFPRGLAVGTTTTADFVLRPAGTIRGVFRDAQGDPVERGMVLVSGLGSTGGHRSKPGVDRVIDPSSDGERWTGQTDRRGAFQVQGLDLDREYGIAGSAADGAMSLPIRGLQPTRADPEIEVELRLPSTGIIVLRVRDDAGARIPTQMARRGTFDPVFAEANEDGELVFLDVAPGSIPIAVGADGHVRTTFALSLLAGQIVERDVVLERGATLEGIVVDDRGEPVEGVEVSADRPPLPQFDRLPASTASTETDADGHFRLTGLRRGAHLLEAWADGHIRAEISSVAAPLAGLRVVLPRTGSVTTTLRADGQAPESVYVEYLQAGGRIDGGVTRYDGGEHAWNDGVLELEGVPSGEVQLRLFAPGFGMTARTVSVGPGEALSLGDIALEPGFRVRGRIVDPDGEPVPFAEIRNLGWAYALEEPVVADEQGRFELEDLSANEWPLVVGADGFVVTRQVIAAVRDMTPIEFVLRRGGSLIVFLAAPNGDPAVGVTVRVAPLGASADPGDRASLRTDRDGIAELRRPPGRYALVFGRERRVITLDEGQETEVRAVLDD